MNKQSLVESMPMLKGLREGKFGDYSVLFYIDDEAIVDVNLVKNYGDETGYSYAERIYVREVKKPHPQVERLGYYWRKTHYGQVVEDVYVTLLKDTVELESYRKPYSFSVKLREGGEELPTAFVFDKDGQVPISKGFYQELLKTVTGGLSVREFFERVQKAKTTEEFIQLVKPSSEEAIQKMVGYIKEHDDVEWTRLLYVFGRFYEQSEPLTLKKHYGTYGLRFDANEGLILQINDATWIINRDGIRHLGRPNQKVDEFLKRHQDGFLKDLLEYLEKNHKQNLDEDSIPTHSTGMGF